MIKYIVNWLTSQGGKKARCVFALLVAGILVCFPSLRPCWESSEQMGGGTICPQLTFPVFSGVAVLVFPEDGSQGQPPTTFSGQMGSGSQELPKLHPVGAGPLPVAFLCSGYTHPPSGPRYIPHGRAEFSTEWKPLPHPSPPSPAFSTCWLPAGREQYFPKYNLYVIWVEALGGDLVTICKE